MFFRRAKSERHVTPGAVFRRICDNRTVETAHVLAVASDGAGIPHVRFSLQSERVETGREQRTLALSSFAELFHERVSV